MAKISSLKEFKRIKADLSGLTASMPIMLMTCENIQKIMELAAKDATLAALDGELGRRLKAVTGVQSYTEMGQAYEAYSEAIFYITMKSKGIALTRTPETGSYGAKRPDFVHETQHGKPLYFEVKALEIADPIVRHHEFAIESLEKYADLEVRAQAPGVHFSEQEFSGHYPGTSANERIDRTIQKIANNVKRGQINFGPTVLVVDLGRLRAMPQGPSGLLPIFFNDTPPAESCVSGELWQIALGHPGERIFTLPTFDGASNLAGHQKEVGILIEFSELVGVMFMLHRWPDMPELLTLWNKGWNQNALKNPCKLTEDEIEDILSNASDGINDASNETGWPYRVVPLRS